MGTCSSVCGQREVRFDGVLQPGPGAPHTAATPASNGHSAGKQAAGTTGAESPPMSPVLEPGTAADATTSATDHAAATSTSSPPAAAGAAAATAAAQALTSPAAAAAAPPAGAPQHTAASLTAIVATAAAAAVQAGLPGANPPSTTSNAAATRSSALGAESPAAVAGQAAASSTKGGTDLSSAAIVTRSRQQIDHRNLPYQKPEDLVATCWLHTEGLQGKAHDQIKFGCPPAPNEGNRADTVRALKLFCAEPCREIDVLLEVSNKLMGVASSVVDIWGGPTGGGAWVCNATLLPTVECPWEQAACLWDLLVPHPALMVVEDIKEDARFAHMPCATGGLRTYISSPIIASDGHRLGGFCMTDFKVHKVDIGRCRLLTNFSELASRELERYAGVRERLKDTSDLVHTAYRESLQPLKRNLASSYDSCIMIIDVSNNFEVLYVNQSWDQWSGGVSRDEAVGRPLPDLLESVTAVPILWSHIASDTVGGARFVVPSVRVRASSTSAIFDISFRCGALEALDNDTLPIALPTFVELSTHHGGIYFGRLHPRHPDDLGSSKSRLSSSYLPLDAVTSLSAHAMTAAQMARLAVPGLKLGAVLGRGGFATAYVAEWHDTVVVCKVQDHLLHDDGQRTIAESEIALGQELSHPHIVRTLAHGTVQLQRPLPASSSNLPKGVAALSDLLDFFVDDFDDFDRADFDEDSAGSQFTMMSCMDLMEVQRVLHHSDDGRGSDTLPASVPSVGVLPADIPPAGVPPIPPAGVQPSQPSAEDITCSSLALHDSSPHADVGPTKPMAVYGSHGSSVAARNGTQTPPSSLSIPAPTAAAAAVAQLVTTELPQAPHTSLADAADIPRMTTTATTPAVAMQPSSAPASSNTASLPPLHPQRTAPQKQISTPLTASTAALLQYPKELRSFLLVEFCDKGCLQDAIDRGWLRKARRASSGPEPTHVVRTALDIAEAMAYLHSKCIVHGDLTGFNILLTSLKSDAKLRGVVETATADQYGRVFLAKVADFGTSRRLPVAQEYIRTGSYATVTHMSPEMLSDSKLGFACDVWAFGVLLWSMWTGSRPWVGMTHAQIVTVVTKQTLELQFPDELPPALAALGRQCLAFRSADRPTFGAICIDLRRLLADLAPATEF